jgi:polar amino acid transport system substrate-binding protein
MKFKKTTPKRYLCIIFLVFVGITNAAEKSIVVATELWEPNYTRADGKGIYQIILSKVYPDRQIEYIYTSYERSKNLVESGRADLWLGSYVDEEDFALFPNEALDADEVSAVYLEQRYSVADFPSALQDAPAAWIKGYDYHQYFPTLNMKIYEVPDVQTGLKMVRGSRVDFFLNDMDDTLDYIEINQTDFEGLNMHKFALLLIFPAFGPTPDGKELASRWDKQVKKLKHDGSFRAIFRQFVVDYMLNSEQRLQSQSTIIPSLPQRPSH